MAVLAATALALGTAATAATAGEKGSTGERPDSVSIKRAGGTAARPSLQIPGRESAVRQGRARAAAEPGARSDFNGDGVADLLYQDHAGKVVLTTGPDQHKTVLTAAKAQIKDLMSPGDISGDGKADALILTPTGDLRLYDGAKILSDGLSSYTKLGDGFQSYAKVFSPGDVNKDGKPDLMVRGSNGKLFFKPGKGAAGFGGRVEVGSGGWNIYDQLAGAGDLNGDGIADTVGRTAEGVVYLFKGKTNGTFERRVQLATGWQGFNQVVGLGDANGDGKNDLLVREVSGKLRIAAGKGDGTFEALVDGGRNWNYVLNFAGGGGQPFYGKRELITQSSDGTLYWYRSSGTGKLDDRVQISERGGFPTGAAVLANVNALTSNGFADLLAKSNYDGHVYNLMDYATNDDMLAGGSKKYNVLVGPGDLNGDGKGDLLARDSDGALWFYAGAGNGTYVQGRVKIGTGWGQYNSLVGSGDLNNDGIADLIARTSSGYLYLYKGKGNGKFSGRVKVSSDYYKRYNKIAMPGDLNGDGIADLLGQTSGGKLQFHPGKATGKGFAANSVIRSSGWKYKGLF